MSVFLLSLQYGLSYLGGIYGDPRSRCLNRLGEERG